MNYKTRTKTLERKISNENKALEKATKLEKRSREKWTKAYHAFIKAVNEHADLKLRGTKKEASLKAKIRTWPAQTEALTKERDIYRAEMQQAKDNLNKFGADLAMLKEQELNEVRATDEIVTEVFSLNGAVVRAAESREDFLSRHVFKNLIDEEGNLLSQVSFVSSNGLRRVIAMVNSITLVKSDTAAEAMNLIQTFFDQFQKTTSMGAKIQALYDLTKQLLVEKTSFKVGPDLYRFLHMEIDEAIFPQLSTAQKLLAQSLRSEKTTSYIRIYERKSRADKWEPVKQS